MNNLLPDLLSYFIISPLILRLTLAIFIIENFWKISFLWRNKESTIPGFIIYFWRGLLISTGLILSILLIIGLSVQLVAIIASLFFVALLIISIFKNDYLDKNYSTYFLLIIISLSLIITGAGWCAIDLPI